MPERGRRRHDHGLLMRFGRAGGRDVPRGHCAPAHREAHAECDRHHRDRPRGRERRSRCALAHQHASGHGDRRAHAAPLALSCRGRFVGACGEAGRRAHGLAVLAGGQDPALGDGRHLNGSGCDRVHAGRRHRRCRGHGEFRQPLRHHGGHRWHPRMVRG